MTKSFNDIAEATRLTKAGRLGDALRILRGTTAGVDAADGRTHADSTVHASGAAAESAPGVKPSGLFASGLLTSRAFRSPLDVGLDALSPSSSASKKPRVRVDAFGRFSSGAVPARRKAAAPLPAGARYERRTFSNAHGTRDYTVYVPARVVGRHMPLVLMLHGCTQDADDFAIGTRMNECAEHRGFVVAYPEQPSSANPSRCWNWFRPGHQARDTGEPAILAGLADALVAEFELDRGRVFAAGLSAGGAMAAILGEVYPDRFAAVGVHSGLPFGAAVDVPSALAAMAGNARVERPPLANASRARVIVVHGDADRTVDPSNGDAIIRQVTRGEDLVVASSDANVAGTAFRRTTYATLDNANRAEHWLIHGLAHAWSGGNAEGSYTHPNGPDASEAMLDFFLR